MHGVCVLCVSQLWGPPDSCRGILFHLSTVVRMIDVCKSWQHVPSSLAGRRVSRSPRSRTPWNGENGEELVVVQTGNPNIQRARRGRRLQRPHPQQSTSGECPSVPAFRGWMLMLAQCHGDHR